MALAGTSRLGLQIPRQDKRLLSILETDGCFSDGIEVTTGCTVGHRTLRIADYGKIAATFVDVKTGQSLRVAPKVDVRKRAWNYAPKKEKRHYFVQLHAYQVMPVEELLFFQEVILDPPIEEIISRPAIRTNCDICGEEIINEREVIKAGQTVCQSCAFDSYYFVLESEHMTSSFEYNP
jgi:formylmethanofuran dehydrogenase subunit E